MIVAMKKIFLVVQNKDIISVLNILRHIGTVHVEHAQRPQGYRINVLKEEAQALKKVVDILSQEEKCAEQINVEDWKQKGDEILSLAEAAGQCKEDMARRQSVINQWDPWGDFSPSSIRSLEGKGVYVRLFECPEADLSKVPKGIVLEKIFTHNKISRCLAISQEPVKLPFPVLAPPARRLSELKRLQEVEQNKITEAQDKIRYAARFLDSFKNTLSWIEEDVTFQEVYAGRGEEETLTFIKGFCPVDRCDGLERVSKKEQWGLLITDPADGENVPTLLRNPKWVNFIKPVFDFINILPGYKEVDISFFFLLFFSIFVGMLIGDAGYGALFFLLTALMHVTVGRKLADRSAFILVYILSGCIMIWGILTGTCFGQQWIPAGTVRPLVPWLNNMENIQMFCFLLGAIHLSIAHIWRMVLKMPSLAFLAEIGWLSLVWGMYYAAKMLILGVALPPFVKIFFILGPVCVIFFTQPNKNPLKSVGPGIGDFLLNVVNTFTDVVSYIRLFAVGLATVAVADAANAMAMEVGFGTLGAGFAALSILFVGHLINIILAVMAVLVHGLRLNVLEFSGHLNMEWAGIGYNPFKRMSSSSL